MEFQPALSIDIDIDNKYYVFDLSPWEKQYNFFLQIYTTHAPI